MMINSALDNRKITNFDWYDMSVIEGIVNSNKPLTDKQKWLIISEMDEITLLSKNREDRILDLKRFLFANSLSEADFNIDGSLKINNP